MGSGAAAEGLLRCVFEGCISSSDMDKERRPYHKNCSCALHNKTKKNKCCKGSPKGKVSYPIRRAWSENCLVLAAAAAAAAASVGSPSSNNSSPSASSSSIAIDHSRSNGGIKRSRSYLSICKEDDDL